MVAECQKLGLSKKGNADILKDSILRFHLNNMEEKACKPSTTKPSGAKPSGEESVPEEPASIAQAGAPSLEPADGPSGNAPVPEQNSELVLFGRQTFTLKPDQAEDKTDFFNDLTDPDPSAAMKTDSYMDLINIGKHGVIPVAAMIKVMQGFQEIDNGPDQLAVLLAGVADKDLVCFNLTAFESYDKNVSHGDAIYNSV